MPRISKTLVAERETFALSQFRAGATLDQCNEALVVKYGMKMGYYRMKELLAAAQDKTAPVKVEAPPKEEVAKPDPFAVKEFQQTVISDGPFYTIPELIRRIEAGEET